jgi:hypothetical protein
MATEIGRFFEVSKVRIDRDGHVSDVLWSEVDATSDRAVGAPVLARVAEVVEAIHAGAQVAAVFSSADRLPERRFVVIEHKGGRECVVLDGTPSPGSEITDLARLDDDHASASGTRIGEFKHAQREGSMMQTYAVSKVQLDPAGRITDVLWGKVDSAKNTWAAPESVAPVEAVVAALRAGNQVFALFPSIHGHLPERRFVVADYDGALDTIVLDGPTARERGVHDMDRLDIAASQ